MYICMYTCVEMRHLGICYTYLNTNEETQNMYMHIFHIHINLYMFVVGRC